MKINFKKIATVLGSALMVGSTIGIAAAANYPEPFVQNGAGDVAVVYGASSSDMAYATTITTSLSSKITASVASGVVATPSGESYTLEKSATKVHLGNGLLDVVSATVDEDELPTLLVEGKYVDDDNDEFDYTQKISLGNHSIALFDDNDYKEDTPTVGIKIANGVNVLNYTLDFSDNPLMSDIETSYLPIMGKEYYVLDNGTAAGASLTLLDSAEDATVAEGETGSISVNGKVYSISIVYIGSTEVKLNIDGSTTNSLAEGEVQKLADGSYVGIKDIMYDSKTGSVSQVQLSIGAGKLKLTSGSDVELNEQTITNLKAYYTNTSAVELDTIVLAWNADGDLFIAPDKEAVMPGFGNIKLTWGGVAYPKEETITVTYGGDDYIVLDNFPLKDSTEDIYLVYGNSSYANFTGAGKDEDNRLRTSALSPLTFDSDTDEYFVASYKSGEEAESYLVRATGFKVESSINKTTIQYRRDGAWVEKKTDAKTGDSISLGNIDLTVNVVDYAAKTVSLNWSSTSVSTTKLYSKEGLTVQLPWTNSSDFVVTSPTATPDCANNASVLVFSANPGLIGPINITNGSTSSMNCYKTTFAIHMQEEDKDGVIANGNKFNITLGFNSASTPSVQVSSVTGELPDSGLEVGESDVWRAFIYSALATEILLDKGGDQDFAKLIYHGEESPVKVYLAASSAVISGGSSGSAIVPVKDSEVSSVQAKNLIVVGGSCINSVAAKLLGSTTPICGSAFTTKTGVNAGQFILQSFASPYTTGRTALLVAGYDAADTQKAATYLVNKVVDTTVGKKKIVSSATEATISEA